MNVKGRVEWCWVRDVLKWKWLAHISSSVVDRVYARWCEHQSITGCFGAGSDVSVRTVVNVRQRKNALRSHCIFLKNVTLFLCSLGMIGSLAYNLATATKQAASRLHVNTGIR